MLKFNASTLGNLFLLCLFGSVFVQPKPSFFAMALGTLMATAILFFWRSKHPIFAAHLKQSYLIWIALLAWPLVHIGVVVLHQPLALAPLGNPIRAFIALGVFVFLLSIKTNLNTLYIGIGAACAAAFMHAMHDKFIGHMPRALGWFNNEIHMGDYSSLVGVFALIIAFAGHQLATKARAVLFILGCLAFVAAAASGTRTAAFSIVCLLPLFWMRTSDLTQRRLRRVLVIAAILPMMVILFSERARNELRIKEAISDVMGMQSGRSQSSIGDRKQMWIAALDMAQSSPLLGIGPNNFQKELIIRIDSKKIQPLMTMHNQAHSQILHSLATGGIVLLTGYLFFTIAPLLWFTRIYKLPDSSLVVRQLAYLGIAHIVCHTIFGLTAAIFDIQVFSSLYLLGLAAFAALCLYHRAVAHPKSPTSGQSNG